MAPEYVEKGIITKMLDVFSLGVIILEIITGQKDYPEPGETGISSQEFIERVRVFMFYVSRQRPFFSGLSRTLVKFLYSHSSSTNTFWFLI